MRTTTIPANVALAPTANMTDTGSQVFGEGARSSVQGC